jgi:RIO kinase 1
MPLTGEFEIDESDVDLRGVLREIEDTRLEQAERVARMAEAG